MEPKYLLIVKVPRGLNILDTPRPQSQGARVRRVVPVGYTLDAYDILNVDGVEYARLVPQRPTLPEWVRVREADGSIEYVEVKPLDTSAGDTSLPQAINNLADAVRLLASSK